MSVTEAMLLEVRQQVEERATDELMSAHLAGYAADSLDKHHGHSIVARLTQTQGFIARVGIVVGVCKDWTAANVPEWKSMQQQILVVTDQFRGLPTFSLDGVLGTLLGHMIDDVCRTEAYLDAIRLLDV